MFSVKEYKNDSIIYLPSFSKEIACPEATRPSLTKIGKYIVEEDGFNLDEFICQKIIDIQFQKKNKKLKKINLQFSIKKLFIKIKTEIDIIGR